MSKLKCISIILSIVSFSFFLPSGCTQRQRETNKITITLSFYDRYEKWKGITDNFINKYPGIEVKLLQFPGNYMDKISTMFAAGTPPDVIFISQKAAELAARDALVDLTPYIERDKEEIEFSDIYPQLLENSQWKGKYFGMPQAANPTVLFYNKNLFDKENIPYPDEVFTWEKYLNIAKRLTKYDKDDKIEQYGTYEIGTVLNLPVEAIFQNNGKIFNKDLTKSLLDTPETIEAIKFSVDLIRKHKVAPSLITLQGQRNTDLFMTGKIAMFTCGWYVCQLFKDIDDFDWDVAPLPKQKRRATYLGINWLVIAAKTKYPEEAWKLVKYLIGKEGQEYFLVGGYDGPVRKSIAKLILTKVHYPQNRKVFIDMMEHGEGIPDFPKRSEVEEIFRQEMDNVYFMEHSVEKTCKKIAERVNILLSQKN